MVDIVLKYFFECLFLCYLKSWLSFSVLKDGGFYFHLTRQGLQFLI